jgi:hypothetical protein
VDCDGFMLEDSRVCLLADKQNGMNDGDTEVQKRRKVVGGIMTQKVRSNGKQGTTGRGGLGMETSY